MVAQRFPCSAWAADSLLTDYRVTTLTIVVCCWIELRGKSPREPNLQDETVPLCEADACSEGPRYAAHATAAYGTDLPWTCSWASRGMSRSSGKIEQRCRRVEHWRLVRHVDVGPCWRTSGNVPLRAKKRSRRHSAGTPAHDRNATQARTAGAALEHAHLRHGRAPKHRSDLRSCAGDFSFLRASRCKLK